MHTMTSNDKYHSTQLHPCPESTQFDCVNDKGDLPEVDDVHKIQPLSKRHHKHDVSDPTEIWECTNVRTRLCVLTYAPTELNERWAVEVHHTGVDTKTKFLNFHRFLS